MTVRDAHLASTLHNNCVKIVIAMDDNEIIHKRRTTSSIIIIATIEYEANQSLLKLLYDISDHCLSTSLAHSENERMSKLSIFSLKIFEY